MVGNNFPLIDLQGFYVKLPNFSNISKDKKQSKSPASCSAIMKKYTKPRLSQEFRIKNRSSLQKQVNISRCWLKCKDREIFLKKHHSFSFTELLLISKPGWLVTIGADTLKCTFGPLMVNLLLPDLNEIICAPTSKVQSPIFNKPTKRAKFIVKIRKRKFVRCCHI